MEERKITGQESLEIITAMISRTRSRLNLGDGDIMLMWGYLTVAVTALVWVLITITRSQAVNWLWFLIWIVGGTVTPIMVRKKTKVAGAKSYTDRISTAIWTVVGLSLLAAMAMCFGFLFLLQADTWSMMFLFALIIVPFGEIAQGIIIDEKSFMYGGSAGMLIGIFTACCIAGDVLMYAQWYLPLFMLAFVCMMIIPGHILNAKARKAQ